MTEIWVDGALLEKAANGDRPSIQALCKISAGHVSAMAAKCMTGNDDVTPWLVAVLSRMANGESPDEAFQWPKDRGRPEGSNDLRNWVIRLKVRDRMRDHGESLEVACRAVSAVDHPQVRGGILLAGSTIKKICAGVTAEAELPVPDHIFPVPLDWLRTIND